MENISPIKFASKEIYYSLLILLSVIVHPFSSVFKILFALFQLLQYRKRNKALRGQVAVITTGSGGSLVRCLALELAKRGCHVAIVGTRPDLAEEIVSHIAAKYQIKAKSYKFDVTDCQQQIVKLKEQICQDLGNPSILINITAILKSTLPLNPKAEEIQKLITTNFTAVQLSQEIFLNSRGHIVNIFSVSELFESPLFSIYADTKPEVHSIISALRANLMHEYRDITGTTVMPVFLYTLPSGKRSFNTRGSSKMLLTVNGAFMAQTILDSMLSKEEEIRVPRAFLNLYKLNRKLFKPIEL